MLWVQLPPEPDDIRPRGAVWSARHPVTVEIMGSNPIGDAAKKGRKMKEEGGITNGRPVLFILHPSAFMFPTARYAKRQSGQAQTLVIVCGFDSHPCY